jgi:hypothetical protein
MLANFEKDSTDLGYPTQAYIFTRNSFKSAINAFMGLLAAPRIIQVLRTLRRCLLFKSGCETVKKFSPLTFVNIFGMDGSRVGGTSNDEGLVDL